MEFYRIWRILVAHKWVLVLLPMIATIVGLAFTYVLPQQYESTALVLVRPIPEIKFNPASGSKDETLDFPVNLSAPIDAPSKTYMEVIKSHAVAVRIVDALKLYLNEPKTYTGFLDELQDKAKTWLKDTVRTVRNYLKYGRDIAASPYELAVEDIEQNLNVAAHKDTYVFDISYRSGDPKKAAAVVNMAAEIFLQESAEAHRHEAARVGDSLEQQLAQSDQVLAKARNATLDYKNAGGTFDLKSEYTEKLKDLSDLQTTLAKGEARLAGLQDTGFRTSPNVVAQQADIAVLKRQIAALQAQLATYPEKEKRLDTILLNEKLAQDSYEFLRKQYEQARIREASNITEIRIVSRGVPSLYPVKPVKYVYAGLSFGTALLVAVGWILFFDAFDPRLRAIGDAEDFDMPVLGPVSAFKRGDERRPRPLSDARQNSLHQPSG